MSKNQKAIGLKWSTYTALESLKEEGQSFDGVIQKLIKRYKEWIATKPN